MTEKQLGQIFKRFGQTTTRENGTGLGLFSSKLIMDALNGQIDYLSTESGGTTFIVAMQLTESSAGKVVFTFHSPEKLRVEK